MYLQEIMNPDSMPQLTGIKNNLRVISEWFLLFTEQITEAWVTERRQEQMKNSKKKIILALAGIMLAGSMGWSQLPAQAAANGETICSHRTSYTEWEVVGYKIDAWGHMAEKHGATVCTDECKKLIGVAFEYGDYEAHDYTDWKMIEDIGNGLYNFWRECKECGYEDEELSDDPNDPKA